MNKKGIVNTFIIILIMIPLPLVQSMSNTYNDSYVSIYESSDNISSYNDEVIDQSSSLGNCGIYNIYLAQSFRPSLRILSKIQIGLFKLKDAEGNVTVSIRDRLYGNNLVLKTISVDNVPIEGKGDWAEFDIDDIEITPNQRYFIIFTLNEGKLSTQENGTVHWIMTDPYDPPYLKGMSWKQGTTLPSLWLPVLLLPRPPDLSFRTYGYK